MRGIYKEDTSFDGILLVLNSLSPIMREFKIEYTWPGVYKEEIEPPRQSRKSNDS